MFCDKQCKKLRFSSFVFPHCVSPFLSLSLSAACSCKQTELRRCVAAAVDVDVDCTRCQIFKQATSVVKVAPGIALHVIVTADFETRSRSSQKV